jgi:hypothetical protein
MFALPSNLPIQEFNGRRIFPQCSNGDFPPISQRLGVFV